MKILIVHPQLSLYGGAETVVVHLARELQKMDTEVGIVTLSLSDELKKEFSGVIFHLPSRQVDFSLHSKNFLSSLKKLIKEIRVLKDLIKNCKNDYDIINVHNFPATWAAALAGIRNGAWMCNEPPDLWNKESPSIFYRFFFFLGKCFDRFLVKKAFKKICVADGINAERIKSRYGCDVEIVPYGIEYEIFSKRFDRSSIRRKYDFENNFVIIQVGIITPQKNQAASVVALKEVKDKIHGARLILVGPSNKEYEEKLKKLIAVNGLTRDVDFLGPKSKFEVTMLFQASDVAIFPIKTQGGWLAPFEALCSATPVIVSSTMGAAYFIATQNIGVVTDDYAKAIADVYSEPKNYKAMAERGMEWVKENLTYKKFAKMNYDIFKNLFESTQEKS